MSQRKGTLVFKEELNAHKFRKDIGLRPIKSGKIKCLKCDRPFVSSNHTLNRICYGCKEVNAGINAGMVL